jgi:hypothetical protein
MRVVLLIMVFLNLSPVVEAQEPRGWRGLVPLQATRRDVEGLLGPPKTPGGSMYEKDGFSVYVDYSDGPCEKGWPYGWNVPNETVTSMLVVSKNLVVVAFAKDNKKYQKIPDPHMQARVHHVDHHQGVDIIVDETNDSIVGVNYIPTTADEKLRCPDAINRLPASRTQADSFQKFDAYGDLKPTHERYRLDRAAQYAVQLPDSVIYIFAYAGREAHSGEAEARAVCARDYLMKEHRISDERIRAIDGGYRVKAEVELYVEPKDGDLPLAMPTLRPSKVKVIPQKIAAPCNTSRVNTAEPK